VGFELASAVVRGVEEGTPAGFHAGTLRVDARGLAARLLSADARLASARIHLVRPGDSARVVCVKDAVEPRLKLAGDRPGRGRALALRGAAVLTCGPLVGFQEGIVDASGPGAEHTPFSRLFLVVLELAPVAGLEPHAHEAAMRQAGLRAAAEIAQAAARAEPDAVERFSIDERADPALPRVAYVCMLLSQGLLHDNWVEGVDARRGLPRVVEPALLLDGGVVSGSCVSACDKNTTWHHQSNPVLRELFRRHGRELALAGVVLTNEPTRLAEKERSARVAVELVRGLRAQGAVISKEGFGNPDADLVMIVRGLEAAGVRTVVISDEYAGAGGGSQSLADVTAEMDAVVYVGNANERIALPPVERTIGPLGDAARLAGASSASPRPDGGLEVELQALLGSTNQLGMQRLSCREV
jgi:glycine reductase